MKKTICAMMLFFLSNVDHQRYLNSMSHIQKAEKIIQDDHLSKITGGAQFIDGFCFAAGIAAILAPIFPPLVVPATVAGAACTVYGIYSLFG